MYASSVKNIQPVRKGVAKVPVILQLEDLECGAACLAMILAYYKNGSLRSRYVLTAAFPAMDRMR